MLVMCVPPLMGSVLSPQRTCAYVVLGATFMREMPAADNGSHCSTVVEAGN